jgi:hypothetical protein
MAPVERFGHTKADDVAGLGGGGCGGGFPPDVEAFRRCADPALALSREEARALRADAAPQRRARFRMFAADGGSPYRVELAASAAATAAAAAGGSGGSQRPAAAARPAAKGCMYRNLPTPGELARMLVRVFVQALPPPPLHSTPPPPPHSKVNLTR